MFVIPDQQKLPLPAATIGFQDHIFENENHPPMKPGVMHRPALEKNKIGEKRNPVITLIMCQSLIELRSLKSLAESMPAWP